MATRPVAMAPTTMVEVMVVEDSTPLQRGFIVVAFGESHRTKAEQEVGAFTQALYDEAKKNGWFVISMKKDWKRIFSFEN
jgi:hypothetical protein